MQLLCYEPIASREQATILRTIFFQTRWNFPLFIIVCRDEYTYGSHSFFEKLNTNYAITVQTSLVKYEVVFQEENHQNREIY